MNFQNVNKRNMVENMTISKEKNIHNLLPLTHPQKRIWYIEKIYPGTPLYNIGGPIRIKGIVDFELLEKTINIFIKKNEGLRLRITEKEGESGQYLVDYKEVKIDFVDFSKSIEPEEEFKKWVDVEAKTPFKLENEALFYFAMFKIAENDTGYFVKFHHIISDGWSINIMTQQIGDIYMKLIMGEEVNENPEHSYIQYIESERKYLESERFINNKSFWKEKFKDLSELFLNRSSDCIKGERKTYELDETISKSIKEFCSTSKISLNTLFVALFIIYLHKTTMQDDIVIGTPVLNRSGNKEKNMFGMFTSTMPFRFQVNPKESVDEMLKKIAAQFRSCYFNQKYPYDILVKDLELKKNGYDNLFNTCVNYYNTRLTNELNGLILENTEFYNGNQIHSLQIVVKEWSNTEKVKLDFDYKVNDYNQNQIELMFKQLVHLIAQIVVNPCITVYELDVMNKKQKEQLIYKYNSSEKHYPNNSTIYCLFEEQVKKTPNKTAICYNNKKLSYTELNEKSNQLARFLIEKGAKQETIIGLITKHSLETVIGLLGILKSGAAFLPIDPEYPADRIKYMLDDCKVPIVLTNCELGNNLNYNGLIVDLELSDIYTRQTSNLTLKNKPNDLAYVIYTSGSTGKPKGTMIEHCGLVNYIWWAKQAYTRNEDEVFPLYSSLAFDLTITSIFTPIISGGRIEVYRNDEDEYVLYRIMRENRSTVIKLTPSHLFLLKDLDNTEKSVKRFIVGGEDLKVKTAKDIFESFKGDIEIYNEYGPTETVVGCMIHRYDPEVDNATSVPIGKPADNTQIYVLDNRLEPVPPGVTGEIYISGDGVSRGYLNMPELTKERFISNPFLPGRRMYRTGDLGRFIEGNIIEYVGRADRQIKIRGYRIELGEIEQAILQYQYVKAVVVLVREDKQKNKTLCAYIVESQKISEKDLRIFLMSGLPGYMIPQYMIPVDKIPLTANGKVNIELLPQPDISSINYATNNSYASEIEKIFYKLIGEILEVKEVRKDDNFYHLGGDSIKAIQIVSGLNNNGFKIKTKDILANPILKQMFLFVEDHRGYSKSNSEPCSGTMNATPIVSWFFSREFRNVNYYNQSVMLELKKNMDITVLRRIMDKIVKHHDSLRLNFNSDTKEIIYSEQDIQPSSIVELYDLSHLSGSEQQERIISIADKVKSSFNIENGLLFKGCLFDLGGASKKLLLTAHHLVIDAVSWRIILEDFDSLLKSSEVNEEFNLPQKTSSYKEWYEALKSFSKSLTVEEIKYWSDIRKYEFLFPVDNIKEKSPLEKCVTLSEKLSSEETRLLLSRANIAYNTETRDLLIVALSLAVKKYTDENNIVIEVEGHGREEIFDKVDVTRTVGWFTSIYPIAVEVYGEELEKNIKSIKEQLRRVPNKGIGYGVLKYMSEQIDDTEQRHIRFNYLGDTTGVSKNEYFSLTDAHISNDSAPENHLTSIIDINVIIIGGCLKVTFIYSKCEFKAESMKSFIRLYMNTISRVIDHCSRKEKRSFTPSDYDTIDLTQDELDSLFLKDGRL